MGATLLPLLLLLNISKIDGFAFICQPIRCRFAWIAQQYFSTSCLNFKFYRFYLPQADTSKTQASFFYFLCVLLCSALKKKKWQDIGGSTEIESDCCCAMCVVGRMQSEWRCAYRTHRSQSSVAVAVAVAVKWHSIATKIVSFEFFAVANIFLTGSVYRHFYFVLNICFCRRCDNYKCQQILTH